MLHIVLFIWWTKFNDLYIILIHVILFLLSVHISNFSPNMFVRSSWSNEEAASTHLEAIVCLPFWSISGSTILFDISRIARLSEEWVRLLARCCYNYSIR